MSFVKDSKEMGKQMSNVAPPPKQEEFSAPPPPVPTQQKIQIVKSADGKIRVRGLLPGQHLFKMPDGKYQIYQLKYQHGAKLAPPGQVIASIPHQKQLPVKSNPSQQHLLYARQFPLCSLPDTALETVLLFLPYDTIAKLCRVNRRFDAICKSLLNKGFLVAKRNVSDSLQQVKSKLPRRDSERDSHPMFNDYGILTTTRLEVAFLSRFINVHVCFIPGKILNEIFSILSTLREKEDARRPQSILNELRDLRVMALEYFEENIAPSFPKEQAPVPIPLEFPAEEEDCSKNECGDGPVANIRENKEAIRACSRRVLKLTKQKKRMKMQLKNMTMQMKQQNMRFNATVKQQKANFQAIIKEMNLKIEQLDRKVKNQEAVKIEQEGALGDKDPTMKELKEELSQPDVSNGSEGIYSIDKKLNKAKDGNVFQVSQTEMRSSKRKREDF